MMYSYINTDTIIVIILFLLPLLIIAFKQKLLKNFTFQSFTKVFNKAIIFQLITAGVTLIISKIMDTNIAPNGEINLFTHLFIESSLLFLIIGSFFYLPFLILLNIANLVTNFFKKAK